MPDAASRLAIQYLLDAVQRIRRCIGPLTEATFHASETAQDAVAMNLIVIGENANRLPLDLRTTDETFDWRGVVNLRHRIAHGYEHLSFDLIWALVTSELDAPEATGERMRAKLGDRA